jgi:hypothetical protein
MQSDSQKWFYDRLSDKDAELARAESEIARLNARIEECDRIIAQLSASVSVERSVKALSRLPALQQMQPYTWRTA